jgi:hypothetical protein
MEDFLSRFILAVSASVFALGIGTASAEPVSASVAASAAAKAWASERVAANAQSVSRESGVVDKGIRLGGPSMRDIREHGIMGGCNSELRKLFGKKKKCRS